MKFHFTVLILLVAGMAGCSNETPDIHKSTSQAPWQPQLDALDKAETVESQIMNADQKRRQQLEQMSQ